MTIKLLRPLYLLFIVVSVISGCSGSPVKVGSAVAKSNAKLERDFSPFRIVAHSDGTFTHDWAGVPGRSITEESKAFRREVLNGFKASCGFNERQLLDIRVVQHQSPVFYEVWVFSDAASTRSDHTSGLSLIAKKLAGGGGYEIRIKGRCHSLGFP